MQHCVKSELDVLRKEALNVFILIGHRYKDWQVVNGVNYYNRSV